MLFIEVAPMDDALVVKDAVAKLAQPSESAVQRLDIALRFRCSMESLGSDMDSNLRVSANRLLKKAVQNPKGNSATIRPGETSLLTR